MHAKRTHLWEQIRHLTLLDFARRIDGLFAEREVRRLGRELEKMRASDDYAHIDLSNLVPDQRGPEGDGSSDSDRGDQAGPQTPADRSPA